MVRPTNEYTQADMARALRAGSIDTVEALRSHSVALPERALNLAAESGSIPLVEYLFEQGYLPDDDTLGHAAAGGHFELVRHLVGRGVQPTYRALSSAGAGGNVALIEFLVATISADRTAQETTHTTCRGKVEVPVEAYLDAIRNGHHTMLQWLLAYGRPANEDEAEYGLIDAAHGYGRPEMVELLRQHGYADEPTAMAVDLAVDRGDLASVRELHRRTGYFACHCPMVARAGHLALLQYAQANGHVMGAQELRAAAEGGQLAVVDWLLRSRTTRAGVAVSADDLVWALIGAARGGHLAVFERLLGLLSPSRLLADDVRQLVTSAAASGNVSLLERVLDTFEVSELAMAMAAASAAVEGHLAVLEFLDPPVISLHDNEVRAVIQGGHLRTLEFVLARGTSLPPNALEVAFQYDQLAIARHLMEQGQMVERWYPTQSLDLIAILSEHEMIPDEAVLLDYIHRGNVTALAAAGAAGATFYPNHVDTAVHLSQFAVVKLLYQYGLRASPGLDSWAASVGECELALFLERH